MVLDRALQTALNARIVAAVERTLAEAGRTPARPRRPAAVSFVDLSGFTSHTVAAGDEAAAAASERLRAIAEDRIAPHGGRLVKVLGDGVLLLFPDAASAVRATLSIVIDCTDGDSLPAHGAIAAGRIVRRQGDVYGSTVNLAARLSDIAGPGEVVVEEGVIVALPRGTAAFEPIGRLELRGFPDPVAAWRARLPDD
jgi:class 3 adenylate cyclase